MTDMDVLLHICCAPCSIYPLKELRKEGFSVTGFFYNPNIHPYSEFERRLQTLKHYAKIALFPLIIDEGYDLKGYLKAAIEAEDRCLFCYEIRLKGLFQKALEIKASYVTTTLLYSRFQRHDEIKNICEMFSERYGIPFLYRDFRAGWKDGIEESKILNLYRQQYCGCIFSELERFRR